ncbi:MAG: TatD family hydrolase [Bradymonadales bacterium]|nr:TatD family hydrolase [Bradymonadales bacterium]
MIDSHCHLDDWSTGEERDGILRQARQAGVDGFVVPAVSPDNWPEVAELARTVAGVQTAYGIHPHYLDRLGPGSLETVLAELERFLPGAAALGEVGLDRRVARDGGERKRQEEVFLAQIGIAQARLLPLIVHCVRAHGRLLELLSSHRIERGGILHWYSGPAELVGDFLRLGFLFGFGLAVGRPQASKARAALRAVPAEALVIETDAPDQPARPGERNVPAALAEVARIVAEIRGAPVGEIVELSDRNLERVLGPIPRCGGST